MAESKNEDKLLPWFKMLYDNLRDEMFVVDKSGSKLVEVLSTRIILNPAQPILKFPGRKTPEKYCQAELDWYDSQDLSVANIGKLAKIWLDISDNDGKINSNYGYLIYSKENNEQYKHCLEELLKNPESRRATMIYTRPSIWDEYNKNGMSDFICTNSVQCFIRDNRLIYIVNMRSNDAIFGFFNDFYWHCIVYNRLWADLQASQLVNLNINGSQIIWNANSFHVYERHFPMLQEMIEQYGRFCV